MTPTSTKTHIHTDDIPHADDHVSSKSTNNHEEDCGVQTAGAAIPVRITRQTDGAGQLSYKPHSDGFSVSMRRRGTVCWALALMLIL